MRTLATMAMAPSTRKNYVHGLRLFHQWRGTDKRHLPTTREFENFMLEAVEKGTQFGDVNAVHSALVHEHIVVTGDAQAMRTGRIFRMLKGYRNASTATYFNRTMAISWRHLVRWLEWKNPPDRVAAATVLGYAFLLRAKDIRCLLKGDEYGCQIRTMPEGGYRLRLHQSKGDAIGIGSSTPFPAAVFPKNVREWVKWSLLALKSKHEPKSGPKVTERTANKALRLSLDGKAHLHGLRHGRCSDLLACGFQHKLVKKLGRWSSSKAMKAYVHSVSLDDDLLECLHANQVGDSHLEVPRHP